MLLSKFPRPSLRGVSPFHLASVYQIIAKDEPIPCRVLNGEDAAEISLAENLIRLPMHPFRRRRPAKPKRVPVKGRHRPRRSSAIRFGRMLAAARATQLPLRSACRRMWLRTRALLWATTQRASGSQ